MEREGVPPDLSKQAIDLWSRYTRDGDLETLHKAVAGFRAAAGAHDPWAASNLSNALLALFKRTGDQAALEEAITVGRAAADAAADPGPEAAALSNLSGALKSSYQLTGNIAPLEEASAALRRGISVAPDASMRGVLLANLSDALEKLYARNDDPDVLREAAATLRDGLGLRMSAGPVPAQEFARLANLLRITYERTGDSEALVEAIAIARRLASGAPSGPQRAGFLSNLGLFLCQRYEQTGEESLLAEALEAHRAAIAGSAAGQPERAMILRSADRTLGIGYDRTSDPALLEERVQAHRGLLEELPDGDPRRSEELLGIAEFLRLLAQVSADAATFDAMIDTLREAVAAAPAGHPMRLAAVTNLGVALQARYAGSSDTAAISGAVGALREAVAGTPEGDPGRPALQTTLAQALQTLYEATGDLAHLEEAITNGSAALSGDDQRTRGLLADCLEARYERSGDDGDLRQAMDIFRGADTDPPSQSWVYGPGRRAAKWMDTYLERRDLAALDRAVELWDRLLMHPWFAAVTPDVRAGALGGAGVAHLRRYQESSDGADLDEALRCCTAAAEFTEHENYSAHLSNLSMALKAKYERDGGLENLTRAAELAQQVVAMTPEQSADRGDALTNLGGIWRRMREAAGDSYLDAEVDAFVAAAELPAADAENRAGWLNNAAVGLHQRYDARGDEADLQRSIDYSRQALSAGPGDHRDRPGWLGNLGNTLRHRYERTGALADLDDAIEVLERAVATAPKQWGDRRTCLTNLGSALRQRAWVSRSPEFLRRALQASAEALELTPPASPEYDLYAANLAVGLGTLASATGDDEHANAQISLYEDVLARVPETSARRPWLQSNLADALLARCIARKDTADLPRALELERESLARTLPGTGDFAHRMGTLAGILARGAGEDRQATDEAGTAFRRASETALTIEPAYALEIALRWARWCEAEGSWATAADAYLVAASAADRLFVTQIDRQDKEAWLRAANGVPAQAAFTLVRTGQPEKAALTLERGRVRLLAEALGRHSAALDRLAEHGHGPLAERFRAAQRRLGALEADPEAGGHDDGRADRMRGDDLASALSEHEAALDAIRQVPGYEHFLLAAEPQDLAAAADIPVVYLAAARLGGVALVVTRAARSGAGGGAPAVQLLELSQLTDTAVSLRATALEGARQNRDRDQASWDGTLDAVCRWLWLAAMGPVTNALSGQPAACLIPTGQLASLPLHAAWTPDDTRPAGRRYALDDLAVSYAPSAVAMLHARELAGQEAAPGLLGVAEPLPVNAKPLPFAAAEVAAAAAILGGPARELHGTDAERARILAELPGHSVVHFACHGLARPDAPLDSALLTSNNEQLTLGDLFRLELAEGNWRGMRLAVLSACETQLPGRELPDELVGLPSGFLQAGAAAVVASQWMIGDTAAALTTTMFYRNLVSGAEGPAALRDAQAWLRDTTNAEKAAFLHPATGRSGLPPAVARPLWRWLMQAPDGRSFLMPSQWAAMTYTGV
jgi:CHAT domain-containing protein